MTKLERSGYGATYRKQSIAETAEAYKCAVGLIAFCIVLLAITIAL